MSNKEIESWQTEQELIAADRIALAIDIMVEKGLLNSRSLISDARLNYGKPYEYNHLKPEEVQKFRAQYIKE